MQKPDSSCCEIMVYVDGEHIASVTGEYNDALPSALHYAHGYLSESAVREVLLVKRTVEYPSRV